MRGTVQMCMAEAHRETWHGKRQDGTWYVIGVVNHEQAYAEMLNNDLLEIATNAGLCIIP